MTSETTKPTLADLILENKKSLYKKLAERNYRTNKEEPLLDIYDYFFPHAYHPQSYYGLTIAVKIVDDINVIFEGGEVSGKQIFYKNISINNQEWIDETLDYIDDYFEAIIKIFEGKIVGIALQGSTSTSPVDYHSTTIFDIADIVVRQKSDTIKVCGKNGNPNVALGVLEKYNIKASLGY